MGPTANLEEAATLFIVTTLIIVFLVTSKAIYCFPICRRFFHIQANLAQFIDYHVDILQFGHVEQFGHISHYRHDIVRHRHPRNCRFNSFFHIVRQIELVPYWLRAGEEVVLDLLQPIHEHLDSRL